VCWSGWSFVAKEGRPVFPNEELSALVFLEE
jgi:hypothetical protein